MKLILGDCLEEMPKLPENSVDTVITDPPYGLDFMGKDWDHGVPGVAFWKAALRVAKPGAMLFAFGGTRTVHRLTCAIEDAGWIIRDRMQYIYGSGFPKSLAIGKAIDKAAGAEREVIGKKSGTHQDIRSGQYASNPDRERLKLDITAPATPAAELWDGYGTALKPAHEPIILAMKPLDGTFAENAQKWGVAGLWIDGGRVDYINEKDKGDINRFHGTNGGAFLASDPSNTQVGIKGRWPANILHDGSDKVLAGFPQKAGANSVGSKGEKYPVNNTILGKGWADTAPFDYGDSGSAARFFYCAKASKSERNQGLDGMEAKDRRTMGKGLKGKSGDRTGSGDYTEIRMGENKMQNFHPTVKPLALMRYLCKLSRTPTGGVILDPFAGSFTTGVAAVLEGRDFIGIDMKKDYVEIGRLRIEDAQNRLKSEQPALFT